MKAAEKYKEAGVDLEKANLLVDIVKKHTVGLSQKGVISGIGGYAGLFALDLNTYKNPVLVSSTDGVGTKIKLAIKAGFHKGIGIDLVAMCVNDIITCGAKPLFFLDYLAFGKFEEKIFEELIAGIVEGCKTSQCALLGGETAEMPGMYAPGDYDCAGFVVGIVERDKIIDGSTVSIGDVLLGIPSSGLHSNGFSLVRKILEEKNINLDYIPEELGKPIGEVVLTPTKIYVPVMVTLTNKGYNIKGCAHITGGGFIDNLPRILPQNCKAVIEKNSWEKPPVFKLFQTWGDISEEEMYRVFNCGIGLVLIVDKQDLEEITSLIAALGESYHVIGYIEKREENEPQVILV
ncbi:phosphoribosylformylglycinamidine cyclo-ligase [Thermodesulfobacterium sp. TA1]|uniref:phosphoribosylformylglycinamidine cyclo-ligase n=1 Tax=Thermodesulfobacterium sp. TA1 TaxID=2234087 RepID=UPI0012328420|nr:phosphoribosylformylglycinamidine cyclo-ligase [Thermodesulfobacterium sp. TA1]QER41604.1 phosphoribosylformylglycinamidine cyclo-ligase [Thermodesulfobacterium sp. TA1]